jgi:hypothetical protein
LKKIIAVGSLVAALFVLVFAVLASAQDSTGQYGSTDQYGSAPNGSADPAQSPTAGQQEATTSGQPTPAQNTPTVRILDNAFDPAQVEVSLGLRLVTAVLYEQYGT